MLVTVVDQFELETLLKSVCCERLWILQSEDRVNAQLIRHIANSYEQLSSLIALCDSIILRAVLLNNSTLSCNHSSFTIGRS